MLQLYLLTVMSNLLAGLVLASDFVSRLSVPVSRYLDFQSNVVYRIIVGCGAFLIGLINLVEPGNVPILGNFFPSVLGIASGLLIVAMWFNSRSAKVDEDSETESRMKRMSRKVESSVGPYHTALGMTTVISAILHAAMPGLMLI